MLGTWVPATRNTGRPQMSCKDNFICTLKEGLNNQISNEATFKEWFPIAADKAKWNSLINNHFQKLCAEDLYALLMPKIMSTNPSIDSMTPKNNSHFRQQTSQKLRDQQKNYKTTTQDLTIFHGVLYPPMYKSHKTQS